LADCSLFAGLPLGLFAQIGLITHLFSLLAPALDPQPAALATGAVTASAIVGRTIVGWVMHPQSNRRIVACASYAPQIAGSIAFIAAESTNPPLLLLGVVLFGADIGNATSLPPLIAQIEFPGETRTVNGCADGCRLASDLCLCTRDLWFRQGIRAGPSGCRLRRSSGTFRRGGVCPRTGNLRHFTGRWPSES
jgi:hypothetical protein